MVVFSQSSSRLGRSETELRPPEPKAVIPSKAGGGAILIYELKAILDALCRERIKPILLGFVSAIVRNTDFFQAIAEGIPRKAQQAGGFALVAIGPAVSGENNLVFPLI